MKFPKERGGYSGMGNSMARFLDTPNGSGGLTNWLHKVHTDPDGSTVYASNKGGHLEVRKTTVPVVALTGLYMAVALPPYTGADRATITSRALMKDAQFTAANMDWSIHPAQPGYQTFAFVGPWADGVNAAQMSEFLTTGKDWTGSTNYGDLPYYKLQTKRTVDGVHVTDTNTSEVLLAGLFNTGSSLIAVSIGPSFVGTKQKPLLQSEWIIVAPDPSVPGELATTYVRRFSDGTTALSLMGATDTRTPYTAIVAVVTPNVRIALRRCGTRYSDFSVGDTDMSFVISRDAGATWDALSIPQFDDEYKAAYIRFVQSNRPSGEAPMWSVVMQCVALDSTTAVMVVSVPYVVDPSHVGNVFIEERVKMITLSLPQGVVESATTIWDSATDSGFDGSFEDGAGYGYASYFFRGLYPFQGKAIISTVQTPLNPNKTVNDQQPILMQMTDGLSGSEAHYLPVNIGATGLFSASGKDTLLCPMYMTIDDLTGIFALESKDRGASWTPWEGMVYSEDVAVGTNGNQLPYFNKLYKIREANGAPAMLHPASPWTRDIRITPP